MRIETVVFMPLTRYVGAGMRDNRCPQHVTMRDSCPETGNAARVTVTGVLPTP